MGVRCVKPLLVFCWFVFLSSCGTVEKEQVPSKNNKEDYERKLRELVDETNKKIFQEPVEKSESTYDPNTKLSKIDQKWLTAGWFYISPDRIFNYPKAKSCRPDDFAIFDDIFDKDGYILQILDLGGEWVYEKPGVLALDKKGTWSFSEGKLTKSYFQYDDNGKKTNTMNISYAYVGKIADDIAILINENGSISAMKKCSG